MPEIVRIVVWALATGIITGGVWAGIVIVGRQRKLAEQQQAMLKDVERRSAALDQLERRFAEVEERLDFTERLVRDQQETKRLPPPAG